MGFKIKSAEALSGVEAEKMAEMRAFYAASWASARASKGLQGTSRALPPSPARRRRSGGGLHKFQSVGVKPEALGQSTEKAGLFGAVFGPENAREALAEALLMPRLVASLLHGGAPFLAGFSGSGELLKGGKDVVSGTPCLGHARKGLIS